MTFQQKEKIKQLRDDGFSYSGIAATLDISENTVKSFCRRNNLGGIRMLSVDNSIGILCRQCGVTLKQTPGKKQKRFCSDKCRMIWWNSHPEAVNRKNIKLFTCHTCDLNFKGYGKRERKYCSRACYGKAKVVRS